MTLDPKYKNARKMTKEEENQFLEDMRMRNYDNFLRSIKEHKTADRRQ